MAPHVGKLERRLLALEAVQETSWILSSVRSRTALADLALDAMLRVSNARAAVLALIDADDGLLRPVAASPGYRELLEVLSESALESLRTVQAVEKRQVTRRSLRPSPQESYLHQLAARDIRGVCNVPLAARRRCPGVILLLYDSGRALGSDATRPLLTLARQVAVALRNLELYEQLKESRSLAETRLTAMMESARILSDTTEPGAVVQSILAQTRRIFDCEAGWIILLARDGRSIDAAAHLCPDGTVDTEGPEELHAVSRWAVETGVPYLVRNPEQHAHFCEDLAAELHAPVRSALCVPLAFGDAVLGTIELVNKRDGPFSNDDIETITAFASQAVLIVKNALLLQETKELAIRDPLTGLYNRRHLMDTLDREMARRRRYGSDVSLIMIDVDDFKRINDAHGHAAGDAVLEMLADVFSRSIRDVDVAARMGGDEFAILLPSTNLEGSIEVAKRLQMLAKDATPTGPAEGLSVSVSQGIAEAGRSDALDGSALLIEADLALYEAKASGTGLIAAHGTGIVDAPRVPPELAVEGLPVGAA